MKSSNPSNKNNSEEYAQCRCPEGKKNGQNGNYHLVPVDCTPSKNNAVAIEKILQKYLTNRPQLPLSKIAAEIHAFLLQVLEELLPPEEKEPPHAGYSAVEAPIYAFAKGFNSCRNQILSTLKEMK